jgi:hypothetical protein
MQVDITTAEFIRLLGQGGAYQHFWQKAGKRSTWFQSGKIPALPTTKDIYIGVHPADIIPELNAKGQPAQPHAVRPQLANIAAINCLFAEFDGKNFGGSHLVNKVLVATPEAKQTALAHIEQLDPTPSVVIDSGGGYHCYWLLEEPWILQNDQDREEAKRLQYAWVAYTGGDEQAKDLCRVLRIPGTQNGKYQPSRPVSILWAELDERYELTELSKLCAGAVEQAAPPIVEQPSRPAARPEQPDQGELRAWGQKQLAGSIRRVQEAPDGQKHEALRNASRWLGGVVAAGGLDEQEAEQALYSSISDRAKDKRNALDTIRDGLAHGMQSPLEPPSARPAAQKSQSRPAGPARQGQGLEPTQSEQIVQWLKYIGYEFRLNKCGDVLEVNGEPIDDITAAIIRNKVRDGAEFKISAVEDAYIAAAAENAYHPVVDYLNGLQWDGHDHIGALAQHLQSDDEPVRYTDGSTAPLHLVYLRRWLIGAVAKSLEQAQNMMLVLAGGQGLGKSALARWLCSGLSSYYIESPINTEDKDCFVRLMSKFVWEVSELDATTRRADVSALKDFVTRTEVTVRRAYGRHDTVRPALASLIGTVNSGSFLSDETGNRRFLVTRITEIDWGYTKLNVNQVWAQAVALYRSGESWRLQPEESASQRETNKNYETSSLLDDWIERWFDFGLGDENYMSAAEIADHLKDKGVELHGTPRAIAMELSAVLGRLGVERGRGRHRREYAGIWPRDKARDNLTNEVVTRLSHENEASESPNDNRDDRDNLISVEKENTTNTDRGTKNTFYKVAEKVGTSCHEVVTDSQTTIETHTRSAQLIRCDAAGRPDKRGTHWKVVAADGSIIFGPSGFLALARAKLREALGQEVEQ